MSAAASGSKRASTKTSTSEEKAARRAAKKAKEHAAGVSEDIAQPAAEVEALERATPGGWTRLHPGHPDWKMKRAGNARAPDFETSYGLFDYDAVKKDPELELWLVRAPKSITPKRLADAALRAPPPGAPPVAHAGHVNDGKRAHGVWVASTADRGALHDQPALRGEEMLGMDVLLPRQKKGGRLVPAPRAVSRVVVVAAPAARADAPKIEEGEVPVYRSEGREGYLEEVLTHRFRPVGEEPLRGRETGDVEMDVEAEVEQEAVAAEPAQKEKKKKKRKGEGEAPDEARKTKKAKTARSA